MKHTQEIEITRTQGLGGSDAHLIAKCANINLNQDIFTQLSRHNIERLEIALGLKPYIPTPITDAMKKGHDFEEEVLNELKEKGYSRELFLQQTYPDNDHPEEIICTKEKHLKLFAHADYAYTLINSDGTVDINIIELKCSTKTSSIIKSIYKWQFQWYYWLGAANVYLMLKDSKTGKISIEKIIQSKFSQQILTTGVKKLPEICNQILQNTSLKIVNIEDLKNKEIQNLIKDIKQLSNQIKDLTSQYALKKEILLTTLKEQNISKLQSNEISISYIPSNIIYKFDVEKFKKENPEYFINYQKQITRQEFLQINIK